MQQMQLLPIAQTVSFMLCLAVWLSGNMVSINEVTLSRAG